MSEAMDRATYPELAADLAELVSGSYLRLTGTPLGLASGSPEQRAWWLYHSAPFGLLAHDPGSDPSFVYANRTAQRCFEYEWEDFVGLPSRLSAEPDRLEDRERLLTAVAERNIVEDYRGVRIAKSGRRFWIEDVTVWNLLDEEDVSRGQAAIFRRWLDC